MKFYQLKWWIGTQYIPKRAYTSVTAWFMAMSISPRPRQKWGNTSRTFFSPSLNTSKDWPHKKKLPQTSKYKNISHNCNIFSKKFWNASDVLRMNSSYTWPGNANILLWFWGKVEDLKYIHPLIQVMGAELSRPPSPQSSPPAFQAKRHLSSMSCVYSRFSSQNTSYKW